MSRSVGALSVRPLSLLTPLLLAGLVACSSATPPVATQPVPTTPPAVTQPAPANTATVRGQLIVPSAFLPSGTSLADVYSKTRIWLYDASNAAVKSAGVDSAGNYTLIVPAGMSGQRLVAVIGSGSAAMSFETSMVPLAASGNALLDITLQSTVDNQYANDPVLKANFDSAATTIWNKAFADQNIAPIDPSLIPANSMLLVGPDLSGDPSNTLLSSQALKPDLVKQGFFDGVGNFFGGVVHGVVGAVQGTVSAVTGGISYVFNGLRDAIAKVVTPEEPRLIVDFDNAAKKLVLTGVGGKVISNDGGSLISQDGGGLISQDGGGLISQDGGGIVASGGGNVISNDGGSFTGGITSSALKAQATTFITQPVGGVARFVGARERCVSATDQLTCVLVGKILTAAVGEKAAVAIAEAAMQTGNLRIAYTLGQLLDAASKQAALLKALQSSPGTTAPTTPPTSVTVSPARASNQKPLASIDLRTGSGGRGAFPYTETFDASASRDPDGSVSFYEWNFGDGTPLLRLAASNGKTVSHTYTRAGDFTATLIVYDNVGGQSDPARQPITVFTKTALPIIGDPSPAALTLSAPIGGSVTATVQYSNLGSGSLNADANPGDGLSVVSNTPKPLAPGETATVTLKATCDRRPGVLETTLIITANDSRIPSKTVYITLYCRALLPVIGDPSPSTLTLSGTVGTSVMGSFTFKNTGGGPLNADANPGSGWLSVLSNTPKPLNPGDTATVKLQATCPAEATTLSTSLIVTANDSRIPRQTVTVNLTCTSPTAALGLGVTTVSGQTVPPSGTLANPVSGTVSVLGYVQAGASPVHKVQLFLVGNPTPIAGKAVSVDAGVRQDNIGEADLDTKSLSNGTYTFFVRATDDSSAIADSAPVTVSVDNAPTPTPTQQPARIVIRQINDNVSIAPNQSPVPVSGTAKVFIRENGNATGFSGDLYLCFLPAGKTVSLVQDSQHVGIQPNGVGDDGYFWNTKRVSDSLSTVVQGALFLNSSQNCDDTSNPTTSFINVSVDNRP